MAKTPLYELCAQGQPGTAATKAAASEDFNAAPFTAATFDFTREGVCLVLIAIDTQLLHRNDPGRSLRPDEVAKLEQVRGQFMAAVMVLGRPASRECANG